MKKILCIISIILLYSNLLFTNCYAQSKEDNNKVKPVTDWNELYNEKYLGVGFLGVIKHPGAEFNYSFPHKFFIKEKEKKGDEVRIKKARRWDVFARYYYHRNFHHNLMLTVGRTWQRSLKRDRFFISQADVGAARTFYTNPTFKVVGDQVKRQFFAGDFYASFNYRLGLGKHFHHNNEVYRVYSYFGIMNYAPFNNLYYSRIVVGMNFNKFLKKK